MLRTFWAFCQITESTFFDSCLITDPNEMRNAQMRLFHPSQQESFSVEMKACWNNPPAASRPKLFSVLPFHWASRPPAPKQLAVSSFDSKHLIVLDSHHRVVRLYLEQLHETHCHQGVDYLRALVQQQFAIDNLEPPSDHLFANVSLAANL